MPSFKYCACYDPSVSTCSLHMVDLCVCMRDVISEFNSEIEGSQVFCTLMLFLCYILCHMCSGRSLHCDVHLAFRNVMFVCVKNDVCEDGVCIVYIY